MLLSCIVLASICDGASEIRHFIFLNLKDGWHNINKKEMFELLKHFVSEHAFQEDQGESAPNDNKCKWDKCNVEFLQKRYFYRST